MEGMTPFDPPPALRWHPNQTSARGRPELSTFDLNPLIPAFSSPAFRPDHLTPRIPFRANGATQRHARGAAKAGRQQTAVRQMLRKVGRGRRDCDLRGHQKMSFARFDGQKSVAVGVFHFANAHVVETVTDDHR